MLRRFQLALILGFAGAVYVGQIDYENQSFFQVFNEENRPTLILYSILLTVLFYVFLGITRRLRKLFRII